MVRVLLGPGETRLSTDGSDPSWSSSSMVNCMCGSCVLICCSSYWLCSASWMTKVSSTYLSHKWGCGAELKALTSNIFLVSIPMQWCLHFTPIIPYTSPHTPKTHNTPNSLLPHFSCTIFGKYTHLFR